jgi:hypothetical protein
VFSWLTNAWRVPELRKRVLFTALILGFYRLGSWIPAPGVNADAIENYFNASGGGTVLALLNLLGRRALPVRRLRARDHAVHHGVDHPPADDRGDPAARAAAEGG